MTYVDDSPCDMRIYRICFTESNLDGLRALAVPMRPPAPGATWSVNRARYRLEGVLPNLPWLGRDFKDVYAIAIRADLRTGIRRFRALFSYSEGLLAFQDLSEASYWFVASQLPSLGHSVVAE
jgi:hypothetical protein